MFKVERQENGTYDIYIPHNDMIEKQCRTRVVTEGVETVQKLVMIDDYNLHMGGVDKSDQLVLYYGYSHRS